MVAGVVNHQENASHTCDVVEESFYDTTCVRGRLSSRLLSRSPTRSAQLARAAVSHGGEPWGAAPPGIAGSAAEPPLIPRERAFANCGTPPDTPRSSIESVNTSRQLQRSSIAPLPVSDVASTSYDHNPSKTKDRSISTVKHRGEMTNNRRDLD